MVRHFRVLVDCSLATGSDVTWRPATKLAERKTELIKGREMSCPFLLITTHALFLSLSSLCVCVCKRETEGINLTWFLYSAGYWPLWRDEITTKHCTKNKSRNISVCLIKVFTERRGCFSGLKCTTKRDTQFYPRAFVICRQEQQKSEDICASKIFAAINFILTLLSNGQTNKKWISSSITLVWRYVIKLATINRNFVLKILNA